MPMLHGETLPGALAPLGGEGEGGAQVEGARTAAMQKRDELLIEEDCMREVEPNLMLLDF
ncbi:hypothetical protein NKDENANG_03014 [Candidatus Entotheonellaceae bacterium PAL068K]